MKLRFVNCRNSENLGHNVRTELYKMLLYQILVLSPKYWFQAQEKIGNGHVCEDTNIVVSAASEDSSWKSPQPTPCWSYHRMPRNHRCLKRAIHFIHFFLFFNQGHMEQTGNQEGLHVLQVNFIYPL